jgi:cholinesterase
MIMQSGTTDLKAYSKNTSSEYWYNITSTLGCGDADSDQDSVLKCMRSVNATTITAAIPVEGGPTGFAPFWPTVDEKIVFSDYAARSAAGKFLKVPVLIGNTDYEGGFYATIAAIVGSPLPRSVWTAFSDLIFKCPASHRADTSVKAGVPTWRYRYFGDWPDLRFTTEPDSGAYHSSELSVLFGNLPPEGNGIPASTKEELAVGNYMRGAWAAFAKDPKRGLKRYGWPRYRPEKKTLVRLALGNRTGANVGLPELYDGGCD